MSGFEVRFTRQATVAFDETLDWYKARSLEAARKWLAAVELALDKLEEDPYRYPRAAEDDLFPTPLYQYAFGGGRKLTHRMVYVIRPQAVVVHAIRHLSQDALSLDDLLGSG
jgi:plasmid stabilization system protein ParE